MDRISSRKEGFSAKFQKLSTPDASPQWPVSDGAEEDAIPTIHFENSDPAVNSQDYFALPTDFLQGVLPEIDLQTSESFIADLNLDQYFSNGFSTVDLTPESMDTSKCSSLSYPT